MREFVRRAAREVRDAGLPGIKGSSGVVKGSRCMQGCPVGEGQGCQSAGGYNKGPGVERPRGQGLCIWLLCYSPPPALVVGEGGVVGLVVGAFVVACVICSVVFSTTELAVVSSAESPVLVRDVLE